MDNIQGLSSHLAATCFSDVSINVVFLGFVVVWLVGFYRERVSLCNLGHPGTSSVDQSSFELKRFACFWLPNAGIKDVCHHCLAPSIYFLNPLIYNFLCSVTIKTPWNCSHIGTLTFCYWLPCLLFLWGESCFINHTQQYLSSL